MEIIKKALDIIADVAYITAVFFFDMYSAYIIKCAAL
jgi:hypothetical protein